MVLGSVVAMTQDELNAILEAAFEQCDAAGLPLVGEQKAILRQVMVDLRSPHNSSAIAPVGDSNPLDQLTPTERQILLQFIREQTLQNRSWKAQLLNDWLENRDSGALQFIRQQYGPLWLESIDPSHLAAYLEDTTMPLQVGDRIQVSNNLWEWTQDDGPCAREWFICTIIRLGSTPDNRTPASSCTVRFENGMEYEIQGIYEWNRYNWRWLSEQ